MIGIRFSRASSFLPLRDLPNSFSAVSAIISSDALLTVPKLILSTILLHHILAARSPFTVIPQIPSSLYRNKRFSTQDHREMEYTPKMPRAHPSGFLMNSSKLITRRRTLYFIDMKWMTCAEFPVPDTGKVWHN